MIKMLKRHEIQVLRRAGQTWVQVAALTGMSVGTARRAWPWRTLRQMRHAAPERTQKGRSGRR